MLTAASLTDTSADRVHVGTSGPVVVSRMAREELTPSDEHDEESEDDDDEECDGERDGDSHAQLTGVADRAVTTAVCEPLA